MRDFACVICKGSFRTNLYHFFLLEMHVLLNTEYLKCFVINIKLNQSVSQSV